jgi:hypothetical protein
VRLADLVRKDGALTEVLPERVMAEGSGNIWLTTVRGKGADRFVTVIFVAGGTGARPAQDGLSATSFPSGIATTPAKVVETTSPLVIRRKELRSSSLRYPIECASVPRVIREASREQRAVSARPWGPDPIPRSARPSGGNPVHARVAWRRRVR